MADVLKGGVVRCNGKCGCPFPCPGSVTCKCTSETASEYDHKKCSCGEHCSCKPCSCGKAKASGTGKEFCRCGQHCTCANCAT